MLATNIISSLDEIISSSNFKENNPVNAENYVKLITEYQLSEDVKCCFEKETGNLCGHDHRKGWVVALNDGSFTIVGGTCAKDKFDASSQIVKDIRLTTNNRDFQQKYDTLSSFIDKKNEISGVLNQRIEKIDAIDKYIAQLKVDIGADNASILDGMVKGSNEIKIQVHLVTQGNDPEDIDNLRFTHKLGSIDGIQALKDREPYYLKKGAKDIIRAISQADILKDNFLLEPKKLAKSLMSDILSKCRGLNLLIQRMDELERNFQIFTKNNMSLLCYLSSNSASRNLAAAFAIKTSKQSEYTPQELIQRLDSNLEESLVGRADKIYLLW